MDTIENLIIELTTLCNLNCIHCGYKMVYPHQAIDKNHLISIIQQLSKRGLASVMFTGGEPTLYPDLIQVARFCKKNGLRVKIATNGSNFPPILTLLDENTLDELVVSVDAVNSKTYESIRGKSVLPKIFNFIEQNSQYTNRFHLSFLFQRSNCKELIPFLHYCKSQNIAKVSILVPHHNGDFTSLIDQKNYCNKVFFSDEEVFVLQNTIAPQLKDFFISNSEMFTCSLRHINALIEYMSNPYDLYSFRTSICSFPLKSIFLYSDGQASLCPYYLNWKMDLNSLLNHLRTLRMRCVFEGKEKHSYCRHCLEVPL